MICDWSMIGIYTVYSAFCCWLDFCVSNIGKWEQTYTVDILIKRFSVVFYPSMFTCSLVMFGDSTILITRQMITCVSKSGDSWMYPYQRTPTGNPYIIISPI